MQTLKKWLISTMLMVGLIVVPLSASHASSSKIIKHRQNVMSAVGAHMGALNDIRRVLVPFEDHALTHARAIADTLRLTLALFPEGTRLGETSAKAAVWNQPEVFKQQSDDAVATADRLVGLLQEGMSEAVPEAIRKLNATCKSCHKKFRTSREN